MFADGYLACRNPGEHLKLDGLHGTGWVAGGRHSFHLFVLAVVTLKSAPVSSLASIFRVPVCANVLRVARRQRNALKRKTRWLAAAVGGVVARGGTKIKGKIQRVGCPYRQRGTLTLGYEHKRGNQQFGLSRDVLGFASGSTLFALVKLQKCSKDHASLVRSMSCLPVRANSRSMARALARPLMAAFPSTAEPSCFHSIQSTSKAPSGIPPST